MGGEIVTLTIARPDRSNALTPALCAELADRLGEAVSSGARVIVLRGAGGRAFCGGFDLSHVDHDVDDRPLRWLMETVRSAPVPVVAVLDGAAVGAGFELACSCHLRIAVPGVKVGVPAVRLGVPYSLDGIATMVRTHPGARNLLMTGTLVQVETLCGFAQLATPTAIDESAYQLATDIARSSPAAIRYTVRALTFLADPTSATSDDLEQHAATVLAGPDLAEAVAARAEGRSPRFSDE